MEDSTEMHSEGNKVSPEKNFKRTLKTPVQVIALENFYNEQKYPTEEMKAELAERIGLTEKQISSWFCHRRLKDKKRDETYANGRQERSTGVIQDRGSGLRQDSCDSTKQGDYRNIDPREVESRRLSSLDLPPVDLTYDRTSRYTSNASGMEDATSESSLSSHDKFVYQGEDPYDMESSRHLTQNGAIMPSISKGANIGYKPSGYLKVKGVEIENTAITAVKRQLGKHYRADGPLLSVVFDPLPPGAFISQSSHTVNGPFYVGDLIRSHSPDACGIQNHSPSTFIPLQRHEILGSKMSSQGSYYVEGAHSNLKHGSDSHDRKLHNQLKQKSSSYSYANSNSPMDVHEDIAGETSVHSSKRNYKMSLRCDIEGIRLDDISNQDGSNRGKVSSEQAEPWLHYHDKGSPKIVQRNDNLSKCSNLMFGSSKPLDAEQRAPHTRMTKEEKLSRELKRKKEYHDPIRVKMHPTNETVSKQFRVEPPKQEYMTEASVPDMLWKTNLPKGSALEKPSSFSEDETAETSLSAD